MKKYTLIAPVLLLSLFGGCTFSEENQANVKQTGSLIAKKMAAMAGKALLNAAIGQLDRNNKEDFLHSAATGIRTEMLTVVTGDDIEEVVKIWTPDKQQWGTLADDLGKAYDAARKEGTSPRVAAESVAAGVQSVAL